MTTTKDAATSNITMRAANGRSYQLGWQVEYSRRGAAVTVTNKLIGDWDMDATFSGPHATREVTWDEIEARGIERIARDLIAELPGYQESQDGPCV